MKPKDESVTTQGHGAARKGESLFDFVRWFASVILLVLVVRTFLYEPFNIPSGSMIPTLQVGDYLWVSKYSYGYSKYSFPLSPNLFQGRVWGAEPHRGDVAVFRFTKNPSIDYVKRIVGLPGDHIQMREGQLYLNGTAVPCAPEGEYAEQDEYHMGRKGHLCRETLPGSAGRTPVEHEVLLFPEDGQRNDTPDYIVPPGYFFAMGDNRDHSADSRFMGDADQDLGFVPMENLVGRAGMIFFSVDMTHPIWQFWAWPTEIRWARLFHVVH